LKSCSKFKNSFSCSVPLFVKKLIIIFCANINKSLKKNNYPYIGFVYGGFDAIHQKSLEYNAELLFHNEKTCILCQQKFQKQKGKDKGKDKAKKKEEKRKN